MNEEGVRLLASNHSHAKKRLSLNIWRFVKVGGSVLATIGFASIVFLQKSIVSTDSIRSCGRQNYNVDAADDGSNAQFVLAEHADACVWSRMWTQLKNQRRIAAESDFIPFSIAYPNDKKILNGENVPMKLAQEAPKLSFEPEAPEWTTLEYFTWIMIDISAPDPDEPKNAPFLHYIVNNLTPVSSTPPIVNVAYYPVSPPHGVHRYISLLFLQEERFEKEAVEAGAMGTSTNRKNFNVSDYAAQDSLVLYGILEFTSSPE